MMHSPRARALPKRSELYEHATPRGGPGISPVFSNSETPRYHVQATWLVTGRARAGLHQAGLELTSDFQMEASPGHRNLPSHPTGPQAGLESWSVYSTQWPLLELAFSLSSCRGVHSGPAPLPRPAPLPASGPTS